MDREDQIPRQNLRELNLDGLAKLCGNVAHNRSVNRERRDKAHVLRVEWVKLELDRDGDAHAEKDSLKKRMAEFLAEVPDWMMNRA